MRNYIIGLSIIFFAISGIITFKALKVKIPFKNTHYQNSLKASKSTNLSFLSEDNLTKIHEEQIAHEALVIKLQTKVAELENKLSKKMEDTQVNVEAAAIRAYEEEKLLIPLNSYPEGAQVLLDESQRGVTPLTLKLSYINDTQGDHSDETCKRVIKIQKDGYESYILSFTIKDKKYENIPNPILLKKLSYTVSAVDTHNKEQQKTPEMKEEEIQKTKQDYKTTEDLNALDKYAVKGITSENNYKIIDNTNKPDKENMTEKSENFFKIEQFVIARNIQNREPIGIVNTFSSSTKKVYCFLEAKDIIKKINISFVWYFQEKEIANVELLLRQGKRWRTYSSKKLAGSKGDWKVELQDASGTVIDTVNFTVE